MLSGGAPTPAGTLVFITGPYAEIGMGGGGSCSQKMDHNGAGDFYTFNADWKSTAYTTELHQAKLKLRTEWIPVQVYEDKTEHSNPLAIPCPGLQMYQSEFGGLQGRA